MNTLSGLLGPSRFSRDGFLGSDPRTPEDIIAADTKTMADIGTDRKKLAAALRSAYVSAERALGNPVAVSEGITAVHHESRGRIPSPFAEDGTFQKGEAVLALKSGAVLFRITPLSISLIEKHGFFQGKGSPYRIEPDEAARVLGVLQD
jgi:hypothetical protein